MLVVWLLAIGGAAGQGAGMAQLEVRWTDDGMLTATFSCRWDGQTDTSGGYATLSVGGMEGAMGMAGAPMLPTMSRIVTVPRGMRLEMDDVVLGAVTTHTLAMPLVPIGEATVKESEPGEARPDKQIYGEDCFYRPCAPATLERLGTMGCNEVYRLTIAPAEYNPVRGVVRFAGEISGTWRLERGMVSDNKAAGFSLSASRYLIVAPLQFSEGLQGFAKWKRQEGFYVEELYVETGDRDSIRAMIASHEADYILLVGDTAQLPPFSGTTHPTSMSMHTTDLYYAERTGDYLPDALLGRWPVNDTAELHRVVDKTLRYEQGLDLDTAMLRRAMLVAGQEGQQPAPLTTNGQVNYIKGRIAELLPEIDTLCWYNPESNTQRADILGGIADGAALINYTAHCTASGWSHPAVNYASIDTLDESQPTFYINNCCSSNAFNTDGFGEQLLRKAVGGAVGVIGATNSTLWNEDYYWAVGPKYPFSLAPDYDSLRPGAFDAWLSGIQQPVVSAGGIMVAGNMAVSAFGSPYDKFYWEIYCLLGDPALRPYLGVPRELRLTAVDTVLRGATQLHVNATPGATVTAVQGHTLLGVATAGADSSATLWLVQPVDTLPLLLTATAPQAIAATDTIIPLEPQGPAVSLSNVVVGDTMVDFTLVNLGDDTIYNMVVSLCPDSAAAQFIATYHMIDTLLPRAALPLHTSLTVIRWAPQWSGMLTAQDAAGTMAPCQLPLGHGLGEPPTLTLTLLEVDSTAAQAVRPNTEYILSAVVEGVCDTVSAAVSAWPDDVPLPLYGCRFTTPDSLTHLHITAHVGRGSYGRDYDYWLTAGSREDSFEELLASYPWDMSTIRPWIADSTESHSGGYSLRSAPIDYRQTSDLLLDLQLMADDSIAFWFKVSSEFDGDRLVFSIDGQRLGNWSGAMEWTRRAYALSAGRHTLRWRYVKDESGNVGSDCAWLDDVRLPLALWDSAYGWFGSVDDTGQVGISECTLQQPTLHPNPTGRMVTLGAAGEVTLTDLYGRTLLTTYTDGHAAIDLGQLPAGIYIVTLRSGGTVYHYKLNKQ